MPPRTHHRRGGYHGTSKTSMCPSAPSDNAATARPGGHSGRRCTGARGGQLVLLKGPMELSLPLTWLAMGEPVQPGWGGVGGHLVLPERHPHGARGLGLALLRQVRVELDQALEDLRLAVRAALHPPPALRACPAPEPPSTAAPGATVINPIPYISYPIPTSAEGLSRSGAAIHSCSGCDGYRPYTLQTIPYAHQAA